MVPAAFTRCCTQAGEFAAMGSMTCDGMLAAIFGCACKMPSNTERRPKPIRTTRRARGSRGAFAGCCAATAAGASAVAPAFCGCAPSAVPPVPPGPAAAPPVA